MTIAKRTPIFQCLLLAGVISLTACGGGGGGKKQPPIDTTPNAITLAASTNAEPGTVVTSAPVTITGINAAAPVSIVGGEYSISGAAFTANPGSITNGQTITVRITASDKTNTPKEAVVTVGGVSAKFTVTTVADVTPDAFTFAPKSDAQLNAEYTSDAITVSGFDVAVPVSIAGGLYSINGGAFTAAAGTVSPGQTVTVKTTAAAKTETAQNAVVTIGGVSGTFTVTTIQDSFAPVAEFKFPTPYTMSEAMSVKVRGTATDDNAITNVKVVVRSYKLEAPTVTLSTEEINATPKAEVNGVKDFSSWTVDVPLTALAENEIKVVATDVRNNSIAVDTANKVVIRQADVRNAFPDEVIQFDNAVSLVFDNYDGRNRALVASSYGGDQNIIAVDLRTGSRSVAFHSPDCSLFGLTIDPENNHIFGICHGKLYEFDLSDGTLIESYNVDASGATIVNMTLDRNNGRNRLVLLERKESESTGRIFSFSLDTKEFSVISSADQMPPLEFGESMLLDGDRYLVPGSDLKSDFGGQIISVNALDGTRTIVSDNTIGNGDLYGVSGFLSMPTLSAMVKDPVARKFFVFEYWSSRIFTVEQETMNRKLFSDVSYTQPGIDRNYVGSIDMEIDTVQGHLFIADEKRQSIIVVDAETGAKVILSKSKNNR